MKNMYFASVVAALLQCRNAFEQARTLATYAAPAVPDAWKKGDEAIRNAMDRITTISGASFDVLTEVSFERSNQVDCGFDTEHDDEHTPEDWVRLIRERASGTVKLRNFGDSFRRSMIKVAALAIAAIEAHDRAMESKEGAKS